MRLVAPLPTTPPTATQPLRMMTLRPRDADELRSWLIDRARAMLYPLTRSRPADDELVLLDLVVRGRRVWLPAKTRYTVPDRRGPIFVCAPRQRAALRHLVDGDDGTRRAHVRLPVALPALVHARGDDVQPVVTVDVCAAGARLRTLLPLEPGRIALDFQAPRPDRFPALIGACVVERRGDDAIVRFADERGCADVRRWLRLVDERGVVPLPTASCMEVDA